MSATYAALANHMEQFKTHVFVEGRDTNHYIQDLMDEGINILSAAKNQVTGADDDENDGDEGTRGRNTIGEEDKLQDEDDLVDIDF
jgi:hypothetical protein